MEVTGVVVVTVLCFVLVFVVGKAVLDKLAQAVNVMHLPEVGVIDVLLIDLCDEHREVDMQQQQYESEKAHSPAKLNCSIRCKQRFGK